MERSEDGSDEEEDSENVVSSSSRGCGSEHGDGRDGVIGGGAEPQGEPLVCLVSFSSQMVDFSLKNSFTTFLGIFRAKNCTDVHFCDYLHFMTNTMTYTELLPVFTNFPSTNILHCRSISFFMDCMEEAA